MRLYGFVQREVDDKDVLDYHWRACRIGSIVHFQHKGDIPVNISLYPPPPQLLTDSLAFDFRSVGSRSIDLLRLAIIAFSLTLLIACGGGGGGGSTAATITPTPMGGPNTSPTVTLPGYAISEDDLTAARTAVGGTAPTNMTEMEIVMAIQDRATVADTFEFSDFSGTAGTVSVSCPDRSCSGDVPNAGMLTFSLDGIEDLSLVDGDMNLVGFDSETQAVMVDEGVTMIQSQAAAGQNDGTHLTFQTYGGWLSGSVFGVQLLGVREEDGTTTDRLASFSFGNNSGKRPTLTKGLTFWRGVLIGRNANGDLIQGNTSLTLASDDLTSIATLQFLSLKNLNTDRDLESILWNSIPLAADGTFESANSDIKGSFYGAGHEEVGGTFNRNNIIGAFGATRQP